jgi:type I restriction enzyme R subunit
MRKRTRRDRQQDNVPLARELRRRPTPTEDALWSVLRARRFHGLKFRRQHPFGPFVLDFYCEDLRVDIEVDGSVHAEPEQARHDRQRDQALRAHDIAVVRLPAAAAERDPLAALEAALAGVPHPVLPKGKDRPLPGLGEAKTEE